MYQHNTEYMYVYYSTLIIIICFVYSGVYTYSQFISACTLSCEKEMCFLLLTHFNYSQSINNVS